MILLDDFTNIGPTNRKINNPIEKIKERRLVNFNPSCLMTLIPSTKNIIIVASGKNRITSTAAAANRTPISIISG